MRKSLALREVTLNVRASSSRITSTELRAAREFLRRLRWPVWSGEMAIPEPTIQETIQATLRELTPRARKIVERTELDDQRVADVARSLGISERQLYRDRASALRAIAQRLPSLSASVASPNIQIRDSGEIRRSHARMLTQVGQLETAMDVFRDLAQESSDPRDKVTTYCALTRLALERGSLKDARKYADLAISTTFVCGDDLVSRYEVTRSSVRSR